MRDPGTGTTPGRGVVGADGSESSPRAIRWAAHEARLRGAVLEVVQHAPCPVAVVPDQERTGR
jgi:nucleotide-binding universal stress UspA family protein